MEQGATFQVVKQRIENTGTRTLTLVYKTGIVNVWEIICKSESNNLMQLIHGERLTYMIKNLNPHRDCRDRTDLTLMHPESSASIKDFKAVYIDGVRIVKNGKLC